MKGIGKTSLTVLKEIQAKGGEADVTTISITTYNTTRLLNLKAIKLGKITCISGYRIALTGQSIQHLKTQAT